MSILKDNKSFDELGENLLNFLRNLTPTILLSSIAFFVFIRFNRFDLINANWNMTFLGFSTLSLAVFSFFVNVLFFCRRTLKAFYELNEYEAKKREGGENIGLLETIKFLWDKGASKQIIICYLVVITSLLVVIISAIVATFNISKIFIIQ
ncbi:MAG: hypothetical protein Q4E16_05565 [Neisseria sp.]|nr:hypothetical protein [Neisseria sp.]